MTRSFHNPARRRLQGLPEGFDVNHVRGFLDPREGLTLHALARTLAPYGPCLEVGSYCGKSALYIGSACRGTRSVLFSVDHHRGSEENQPGEAYHDAALFDERAGRMDSLPAFRETLRRAGLEDTVIPVVGSSAAVARHWQIPLSLLFIDGGHSMAAALADYRGWIAHLKWGGVLAIHDVFPNPADGGRPPYEIYKLALMSGLFAEIAMIKSLALLRRQAPGDL